MPKLTSTTFQLAVSGDRLLGCAALERYGSAALLRSVAVAEDARGIGLGVTFVEVAIARGQTSGVTTLVLLTTTAERFYRALASALCRARTCPARCNRPRSFVERVLQAPP